MWNITHPPTWKKLHNPALVIGEYVESAIVSLLLGAWFEARSLERTRTPVTVTLLVAGVLLHAVALAGGMLVHEVSVLLVILNALRLVRLRGPERVGTASTGTVTIPAAPLTTADVEQVGNIEHSTHIEHIEHIEDSTGLEEKESVS